MRNCDTCRFDRKESVLCYQGHHRELVGGVHVGVYNCHAWEEREKRKCWCEVNGNQYPYYTHVGHIFTYAHFCPECGRKLDA